jgi:carbonic anhydrase
LGGKCQLHTRIPKNEVRSGELVVSTRVLGTTEIMLLSHTGCGFTTTDKELNAKLAAETGESSPEPMRLAYKDPVQNTREQIKIVRSHTPLDCEKDSCKGLRARHEYGSVERGRGRGGAAARYCLKG